MYKYKFISNITKKFHFGYLTSSGRAFHGQITVHHRANGNKLKYLKLDYFRRLNAWGWIIKIFKNSFYTSFIGLILYENGLSNFIILSESAEINRKYFSGSGELNYQYWGNSTALSHINLFSLVSNIELLPYRGMRYARAAGTYAVFTARLLNSKCLIKLKSGWNLYISKDCVCVLGKVSNHMHMFRNLKKAGVSRALGIRPTVRGVVMNPCDHPHGGGEGKKSGSVAARSPWGWITKGGVVSNKKLFKLKKKKELKTLRR